MKQRIINSVIYSNIFVNCYFYIMSDYDMLYKSFLPIIIAYTVLVLFVSLFFYFFFYFLDFFNKKRDIYYEYFAIVFSIFSFRAFVYCTGSPFVGFFLDGFGINFDNYIIKILFFISIILIFYFFSKFLRSVGKTLFAFFRIYSVLLIALIFYYSIFEKPMIYLVDDKEVKQSFKSQKNNLIPERRVIFIVLDEFDNKIALKKDNLDNFTNLKNISVFGDNIESASVSTMRSIPSLLTGRKILKFKASLRKREVNLFDGEENFRMDLKNSLFGKIKGGADSSLIIGQYFSYCLIFKEIDCVDDMNIPFNVNKDFGIKLFINDWMKRIGFRFRFNMTDVLTFREKQQLKLVPGFIERFDKKLIFMHLFIPHLPTEYIEDQRFKIYDANLQKADKFIGDIINYLKFTPKEQDYLLIITSDHGVKRISKGARAVPMIIKEKNDDQKIIIAEKRSNIVVYNLILEYLSGKITSHFEIAQYINNFK